MQWDSNWVAGVEVEDEQQLEYQIKTVGEGSRKRYFHLQPA